MSHPRTILLAGLAGLTLLVLAPLGRAQQAAPIQMRIKLPQDAQLEVDGRIVITAAKKFGARGVGIDLNPVRVRESKENAKKAGVEDKVQFREGNVLKDINDINRATVVTLYLLPEVNLRIRPMLQKTL